MPRGLVQQSVRISPPLEGRGLIASIAGLVPTLLLCILVGCSFPVFFDIEASVKDYLSIVIFFQVVFPMLLFLSRIVKGL